MRRPNFMPAACRRSRRPGFISGRFRGRNSCAGREADACAQLLSPDAWKRKSLTCRWHIRLFAVDDVIRSFSLTPPGAESEIWTRDPFITSEVLYRWAICITCWKLEDSDETKGGFCIGVQHCVQQSLPAIACRLMIKWFINRELYGMRMKEDKHCNRGIFKPPLQSLSS